MNTGAFQFEYKDVYYYYDQLRELSIEDSWRFGFQVLVTRNGMRRCVSNRRQIPARYLEQARKCRRGLCVYLTLKKRLTL